MMKTAKNGLNLYLDELRGDKLKSCRLLDKIVVMKNAERD